MTRFKLLISIISTILVLLLLPVIFNEKIGLRPVGGPDLSELEYSEVFFENPYKDF